MTGSSMRKVSSAAELLAVAHAMEEEAGRRYGDLAARMLRRGDDRLAELFTFLAGIEGKHAVRIEQQAVRTLGHGPDPVRIGWDVPENFDEEEASSRLLTPYLALAIAVRNEERAFAFFCYVAAEAPSADIRILAEELAKEELTHATLLRRERRKAYRDQARTHEPPGRGAIPATVRDFLIHAAELESTAAGHHSALSDAIVRNDEAVAAAFARAAADEARTATRIAERLGTSLPETRLRAPPTIEDGLRILEETFNFYADVAERSDDEAIVREAQTLAEGAVARLALAHDNVRGRRIDHW